MQEQRRGVLRGLLVALLGYPLLGTVAKAATTRRSADVRRFGAKGDGRADDTLAFQRAIDSLASGGGVVRVPAGRYLIDPLRSVRMRSHVDLRMDAGAKLLAKPNAAPRAYVLLAQSVTDATISGGAIVGERAAVEGGARTATLRAVTPCRVVVLDSEQISKYELTELALSRRREEEA